jgi:hypothetical protein
LHTPAADVARSLLVVRRRGSLSAAEELTGHTSATIARWLRRAGAHAPALTDALVHALHLSAVEVDAFWSFVPRSGALRADGRARRAGGARGGGLSVERPPRFVVAWASGPSAEEAARSVGATTRRRTAGQCGGPGGSDGRRVERRVSARVDRAPQRTGRRGRPRLVRTPGGGLTQAVKRRRNGRVGGGQPRAVWGPARACPDVVYEERLTGVLRDRLNGLTRKTHAFAKDLPTWEAARARALFAINWLRPHPAVRVPLVPPRHGRRYQPRTPAMASGLTDQVWTWDEFLHHRHY